MCPSCGVGVIKVAQGMHMDEYLVMMNVKVHQKNNNGSESYNEGGRADYVIAHVIRYI
jgi:hypothetical protein